MAPPGQRRDQDRPHARNLLRLVPVPQRLHALPALARRQRAAGAARLCPDGAARRARGQVRRGRAGDVEHGAYDASHHAAHEPRAAPPRGDVLQRARRRRRPLRRQAQQPRLPHPQRHDAPHGPRRQRRLLRKGPQGQGGDDRPRPPVGPLEPHPRRRPARRDVAGVRGLVMPRVAENWPKSCVKESRELPAM